MRASPESDSGLDKQSSRKDWIEKHNIQIRCCTEEAGRSSRTSDNKVVSDSRTMEAGESCQDLLRVPMPCGLSLSTLTGLSATSQVVRPCQIIKTASGTQSTRRPSPSVLLQHGYDWVSAEDQRILTMMVTRREAQLQEQEMLMAAARLWNQDRILHNQMMNEKRRQWNAIVQERRKMDKMEQERRKEMAELSLTQHIAEIEQSIQERHKRCEQRHQEIVRQRRQPKGETDADTELHRLRRQQQLMQAEARSLEHISQVHDKERKADQNLAVILCCRDRTMKDRRKERERRMQAAQEIRQVLAEQWEQWCQHNRELLSSRMSMSEFRHENMVQWRRKLAHDTNVIKAVNHTHAMALLCDEESQKSAQARQELLKKEMRMRSVQNRRENKISRSRQQALTTAALRMQIKQSYPLIR